MKRILTYILIALSALMTVSCKDKATTKKTLLPSISGKAGEVLVVINKADWEGATGTTLRDSLECECQYLPQREHLFTLTSVTPSNFTNMFRIHRNILIMNISSDVTEPGVVYKRDAWAAPQCVIYINAADAKSATQIFLDNCTKIIAAIEQAERERIIANSRKYEEHKLLPIGTKILGGTPHFPAGYQMKKKTEDFAWITYDTQFTMQSILMFKYPVVKGEDMMSLDNIIRNTNEVLKNNVPGMFENTYMTITDFARPTLEYLRYKGRDFAQMRGFWEVHNDYMGGPFVSHVFYSPDGTEMIELLGFVHAPKYDKRQYLRQVESIIYSFEWAQPEEKE